MNIHMEEKLCIYYDDSSWYVNLIVPVYRLFMLRNSVQSNNGGRRCFT